MTALAVGSSAVSGCQRVVPQEIQVGHHHVQLVVPEDWEHLDHGREQLFRHAESQISLQDMGVATPEGLAHELHHAQSLLRSGRSKDAQARIHDLRSAALQVIPKEKAGAFWRPWTDVTSQAEPSDVALDDALTDLIDAAAAIPALGEADLTEQVLALSMDMRRREVANETQRTIDFRMWIEVETWDHVSHLGRSRLAYTENGGYLLLLTMDRGPESNEKVFEELLASIRVLNETGVSD